MFHQVEGLLVDRKVTFAELKGTLDAFVQRVLRLGHARTRFRPSFFPFTEPSARGGRQLRLVRRQGLPRVQADRVAGGARLRDGAPQRLHGGRATTRGQVTGFAFGMGVERMAMLRYGIDDLRMMFENDVRFLEQF